VSSPRKMRARGCDAGMFPGEAGSHNLEMLAEEPHEEMKRGLSACRGEGSVVGPLRLRARCGCAALLLVLC
jgi:hypothetical protein